MSTVSDVVLDVPAELDEALEANNNDVGEQNYEENDGEEDVVGKSHHVMLKCQSC